MPAAGLTFEEPDFVQHYAAYGLRIATDFPFTWPLPRSEAPADLGFDCVTQIPFDFDFDAAPVHAIGVRADGDAPDISYHRSDRCDVVRVRGVADHFVFDDRIVCHLHEPRYAYLVEIQLLGMVLALWLERRGVPTLHASAVVVEGRAVAFLAAKGGGKTTAATALVRAGHALLADDLLALELEVGRSGEGKPLAQPGYPMLRLWPDQAEHFVGRADPGRQVHPAFDKRSVVLDTGGEDAGGGGFGRFHGEPAPLARVYVPVRAAAVAPGREKAGERASWPASVAIEPRSPSEALLALVQHSYLGEALDGLGLSATRFARIAEVCRRLEVCTLEYPDGFARLPELVAAVERDVARSASRAPEVV